MSRFGAGPAGLPHQRFIRKVLEEPIAERIAQFKWRRNGSKKPNYQQRYHPPKIPAEPEKHNPAAQMIVAAAGHYTCCRISFSAPWSIWLVAARCSVFSEDASAEDRECFGP